MSDIFDTSPPEGKQMSIYEAAEALGTGASNEALRKFAKAEIARASVVGSKSVPLIIPIDADTLADIASLDAYLAIKVADAYQRNTQVGLVDEEGNEIIDVSW